MVRYTDMIRQIREDKNLKQQDIANYLEISQQTYSRYETGVHEMPVRYIIALSHYYNISADYLLGLKKGLPYPER